MYRGTTPTISFKITSEFDLDTVKEVLITLKTWEVEKTFAYSENKVYVDSLAKTVSIGLSQEDTLEFEDGTVEVQMRLLDDSDVAYASEIYEVEIERILKDGVIKVENPSTDDTNEGGEENNG